MLIRDIINVIEYLAPPATQESWDNTGLQIGSLDTECTGVTICVDCTPDVIEEAVSSGNNLIIAHHPLIFKPLKHITGSSPAESIIIRAITEGIAVYSTHTALDSAPGGISHAMGALLGLNNIKVLAPRTSDMLKLTVFVPIADMEKVRQALFNVGAGGIGLYDSCSYTSEGKGSFRPLPGANPTIGDTGSLHYEPEIRLEMIVPRWLRTHAEQALRNTHPYEEPAYEFIDISTGTNPFGLGIKGYLPSPVSARDLAVRARDIFGCTNVRVSSAWIDNESIDHVISHVAVCGGAGGSLINTAICAGAQAYITGDLRHHDFVDYSSRIFLIDIGHFDGEKCARNILFEAITEIFPNFAVTIAKNERNPIKYL